MLLPFKNCPMNVLISLAEPGYIYWLLVKKERKKKEELNLYMTYKFNSSFLKKNYSLQTDRQMHLRSNTHGFELRINLSAGQTSATFDTTFDATMLHQMLRSFATHVA